MCIFLATTDEKASYKGKKIIIRLIAKLYESIYCHSTLNQYIHSVIE